MIDKATIDRIFAAANIVEVVGDFVTLKKKGINYQACCPFHNEKTPSFVVSPSKGLFKCFGCGKAGNAVTFVMEHEGISYPEALKAGMANLLSHVKNIREVWQSPVVVALNRFATDTAEELDLVASLLAEQGVACAPCNGWAEGGKGTTELAKLVCEAADANPAPVPSYTYPDEAPLKDKIRAVATRIYHAAEVSFAPQSLKDLAQLEGDGYAGCPVCIAKTQYSMSDDASRLGAPEGYALTIRSARLSAGAGFVVAFAGSIIAMPGLPKVPAALGIDVDEQGEITGLF